MSEPQPKRPRITCDGGGDQYKSASPAPDDQNLSQFDRFPTEVLVRILSFLGWREILKARASKQLKQASLVTPVFECIEIERGYDPGEIISPNRLVMQLPKLAGLLPMVENLELSRGDYWKTHHVSFDVEEALKGFQQHLKRLSVVSKGGFLSGRVPILFQLSSLEHLDIGSNSRLAFDLSDLLGLPNLEAFCCRSCNVTGSLASLSHLRDKLEELNICHCPKITGSIIDLADFSSLRELRAAFCSGLSGSINDIMPHHFPVAEVMTLCGSGIIGAKIPTVEDAPEIMAMWRRMTDHPRPFCPFNDVSFHSVLLASDSPDRYGAISDVFRPPFEALMVQIGSRCGFVWANDNDINDTFTDVCDEVNWLDPEPSANSGEYEKYVNALEGFREKMGQKRPRNLYHGKSRPPTEDEYDTLAEENSELIAERAEEIDTYSSSSSS